MNTNLKRILCIVLAIVLILLLFLCIKNFKQADTADTSEEPEIATEDNTADQDNDIYFEEENDDAEIELQKKDADNFIGSWTATSAQALYQYGNVDLNINAGGTWNGNVAYEDLEGSWTETADGIHLTSNIFDCDLKFTKGNLLVMFYSPNNDGHYLTTVLSTK